MESIENPSLDGRDVQRSARPHPFLVVDDRVQRHLLPDALPGPGRHAAPLRRLPDAVRRLQHDRLGGCLLLRLRAGVFLPVRGGADDAWSGRKGAAASVGRRRRPGVGSAVAGTVPHLREPAQAGRHGDPRDRLMDHSPAA